MVNRAKPTSSLFAAVFPKPSWTGAVIRKSIWKEIHASPNRPPPFLHLYCVFLISKYLDMHIPEGTLRVLWLLWLTIFSLFICSIFLFICLVCRIIFCKIVNKNIQDFLFSIHYLLFLIWWCVWCCFLLLKKTWIAIAESHVSSYTPLSIMETNWCSNWLWDLSEHNF